MVVRNLVESSIVVVNRRKEKNVAQAEIYKSIGIRTRLVRPVDAVRLGFRRRRLPAREHLSDSFSNGLEKRRDAVVDLMPNVPDLLLQRHVLLRDDFPKFGYRGVQVGRQLVVRLLDLGRDLRLELRCGVVDGFLEGCGNGGGSRLEFVQFGEHVIGEGVNTRLSLCDRR